MLQVNDISLGFGGSELFSEVSFQVGLQDRIGLVGKNGAGKSTLLKLMTGTYSPDEGEIIKPNDYRIGYLAQDLEGKHEKSVREEAWEAFPEILNMERKLWKVEKEMAERTDYESDAYMGLIEKLNDITHQLELQGAYKVEEKIERILKGLGFEQADMERPLKEFSGGWQMRVELAKILLREPNLILLDEPTNHLDIESIIWLEEYLRNYPGAIIMVSHDRTFLDQVTNRTIEIIQGQVEDYKASYSRYKVLRQERRDQQKNQKKNQDRQIAQMERNIERFRAKANKAKFAQSLIKKLDKVERIEIDEDEIAAMKLRFPEPEHSGKVVFKGEGVSKSYGDLKVIEDLNFEITRGDRIAFVGKNGMGKTTLSRILVGDLNYTGKLETGYRVKIGYYAQQQAEALNGNKTVFETIDEAATGDMRLQVRNLLGAFLFSGDDVHKKVKVLSGGEKSRLALCKLMLEPVNVLIMDEPTNHLDMLSKDLLKQALMNFKHTLIVVSHDRDFLQGLTDKVFEFRPKEIKVHLGDVRDFLQTRKAEDFRQFEIQKEASEAAAKKKKEAKPSSNSKEIKQQERKVDKAEKLIARLEKEISEKEQLLQDPEEFKKLSEDQAFFDSYEKLKKDLESAMEDWEKEMERLESMS
jgi:ATP-binding cassette subfamily F protein 3